MSTVAPELRYSAEHEWVAADNAAASAGAVMTVGVTAVAAEALGDIVYLDLPETGSFIMAGQGCGEIESTKSVSDLYVPVTGEVTEVNPGVMADPALVNQDPYGAGWLFKVAVIEEGPLLSASEYAAANGLAL